MDSEVYGHFGSAPAFVIVDTETEEVKVIRNEDHRHAPGMCNPLGAIGAEGIDVVIVGGIGGGALMKLRQGGIAVYKAAASTVRENLGLFSSGGLPEFLPGHVCGGHGSGCSH